MKLFKQQGWICKHNWKKRAEHKACQKCLCYDWFWCRSKIGFVTECVLLVITFPFWWLKWGRHMDKKGFMKGEKK